MNKNLSQHVNIKEYVHKSRPFSRLIMLLLISTTTLAACYDKPIAEFGDSWWVWYQDCSASSACKAFSTCSYKVRDKATYCDLDTAPTGKACSMDSKTRKWKPVSGNCMIMPDGLCGCGNKVGGFEGPPEPYQTCVCTDCPAG